MSKTRSLAITSTTFLAAGMAQGSVVYTDTLMWKIPTDGAEYPIDLNGDFQNDCNVRFDGNQNKPFVDARRGQSGVVSTNGWTLSNTNNGGNPEFWGAPVTPFGTAIDAAYATTNPPKKTAYLYQDYDQKVVGAWPNDKVTDAYVGMAMMDGSNTNYAWIHLILDGTASPKTMTVVGYAYETTPGKGILTGARVTPAEPVIYTQPVSQTVGGGQAVQLKVQALADPAPSYQWQAGPIGNGVFTNLVNNGHITGVDTPTLAIDSATLADKLDYRVIVSNTLGSSTSAPPATLNVVPTVLSGPFPSDARIFIGQNAQFDINVLSGTPTAYRWRKDTANLSDGAKYSGTGTGSLIVSNVTSADGGSFDVSVTSLGGSTLSSLATLTPVPTNGGTFEAVALSNSPKSYYRLNETADPLAGNVVAYDNVGGKNGVYGGNTQNGNPAYNIPGPRPADGFPGFKADNTAVRTIKNDTNGIVTLPPWNLNTNAVTLTAWINPASEPGDGTGILYTRDPNSLMVCGMQFHSGFAAPPPYALGYNWNDQFGAWAWNSGIVVPVNQWSFVSLAVTPTNAIVRMITGDRLYCATNTMVHNVQSWNLPVYIGNDPVNASGGNIFDGSIDEVAVYRRTLSEQEVVKMYTDARGIAGLPAMVSQPPASKRLFAGQTARFTGQAVGTGPIVYQWKHDGTNVVDSDAISGATTPVLAIANISGANAGSYTLAVTNAFGGALSSPATLTIQATADVYESQLVALASGKGLAAYYGLNETEDPSTRPTAYDFLSGFNGVYGTGVLNGFYNIAGPRPSDGFLGFSAANASANFAAIEGSQINLPALHLNTNAVTITAWINPAGAQAPFTGVVFCRGNGTAAGLEYTQTNQFGEVCLGYQWNTAADTYGWSSGLVPPPNMWSFVALVMDPSAGTTSTATIYLMNANGSVSASNTTTNNLPIQSFAAATLIGRDSNEAASKCFYGSIDDVAIYSGALSAAKIAGLYNTAVTGIQPPPEVTIGIQNVGSQVRLSWPSGTLLESSSAAGPWTTNSNPSPYLFTPVGPQKFFRVVQ